MSPQAIDAFLPFTFRGFLREIHEVEAQIRSRLEGRVPSDAAPLLPDALRGRLVGFLEQRQAQARMQGRDPESPAFRQGLHLVAAAGDAVLAPLPWTGQPYFEANPLRDAFPLPDAVPSDLLDQARQLLDQTLPDLELAQVLLLALSIELPSPADTPARAVEEARRRLLRLLAERLPGFAVDPERVFPAAYERRQPPGPATYLSVARGWIAALAAAAAVFLAASFIVWWDVTESVRELVGRLLSALAG